MAESSATADAIARKSLALAMKRLALTGQNVVAEQLGVSASTVSRYVSDSDGLERAIRILAAVGVKAVPATAQCFSPRKVAILLDLARDHLDQMQSVDQIERMDDE